MTPEGINQHLISCDEPLVEALRKLNALSGRTLTLFAFCPETGIIVGSVTDGDIRRALISGADLSTSVEEVMKRDFAFIEVNCADWVEAIADLRRRGIKLIPVFDHIAVIKDLLDLRNHRNYLPVDAVLMAGGKGQRLRPLTANTPKPLLNVGPRAIIDYNIDLLRLYGIRRINVAVNYLKEQIITHFEADPQVRCIEEPSYLGTMGGVRLIDDFTHDAILVMNADIFTDIDLEDFYLHFRNHGADMSVAAAPYSVSVPYGVLRVDDNHNVTALDEKPTYRYLANAGIYLLHRRILSLIPPDRPFNATDLIALLMQSGRKVTSFPLNSTWVDIGSPADFARAQSLTPRK